MNIKKYEDYFHDGSIYDINHQKHDLIISMASNGLDPEDFTEKLELDHLKRIRGNLHISSVKKIYLNGELITYPLIQIHECATILDFEIFEDKIVFKLEWINFQADKRLAPNFSMYEIFFESYYWENDPTLVEPYNQH